MEPGRQHLDAAAGRTVVYCHQCQHEWYEDEHGVRQCPNCDSDVVEVVTPGADDPRMSVQDDGIHQFDRTPHPYHLHNRNHRLENADDDMFEPDPDEGDIEEHVRTGRGVFVRTRFYSPRQNGHGNDGHRAPADPNDPASVIQRFQEMLMNDFSVGAPGRSGPDTLFPGDQENPFGASGGTFQHRTTFVSNGPGGSSVAFTLGGFPAPPPAQTPPFEQLFSSFMRPPNQAGSPQPPAGEGAPRPANPGGLLVQSLTEILAALMGGGVTGDVVYSQEAMDRILTQLMEQNPLSNAPPPASDAALKKLTRKQLDAEMLGPDGKGECTICIDEMKLGDQATVLPCKHWFHEDCVVSWLKEHNTCPICRHSVESERETGAAGASGSDSRPSAQASSSSNARDQPATPNLSDWPALGGGRPTRSGRTEEERRARLDAIRASAGLGPASHLDHTSGRRHSQSPDSGSRGSSNFGGMERDRERDDPERRERDRQSRLRYFGGYGRSGPNGNEGSSNDSGNHSQNGRRYGNIGNGSSSGSENNDGHGISGWLRNTFQSGRRS